MPRFVLILGLLSLLNIYAKADNPDSSNIRRTISYAIDYYWGHLQYHHPEMAVLKQSSARAVKVSYTFSSDGSKLWHKVYRYPQVGLSYMLMDLGYRDVLGYSHSLSPFISIPAIKQTKGFSSDIYVGAGIGFMRKVYHPFNNDLNTAISTHFNVYIDLGLTVSYRLNQNLRLKGGAHLVHFSNGSAKKPNYGLNYTQLSIGAEYGNVNSYRSSANHNQLNTDQTRIQIVFAGSRKEAMGYNGPKFGVATGSLEVNHPIWSPLFRIGGSFDFMYDDLHSQILKENGIAFGSDWETAKLGTALNAELILDRLSLILHFGGYYYNLSSDTENQWVYQRVGLRYRLTNRFWAHLALKTHWNIADYIEFGIAVKII